MHVNDREQRIHLGGLCDGIDIGIAPGPGGWRGVGQFADLVSNGFRTGLAGKRPGAALPRFPHGTVLTDAAAK